MIFAIDCAILMPLSSRASVQPTQYRISTLGSSANVLILRPRVQSVRFNVVPRQGWPRRSMLCKVALAVSGRIDCSTRLRLRSTILSMCCTQTGQTVSQAPQVVQAQISSSKTTLPASVTLTFSGAGSPLAFALTSSGPALSNCFFRSWITFFGLSGLPVVYAGHSSWQLPQTTQA